MRIVLQPYVTIPAASRITGLSEYRLRRGCKDGTIPHVRSGEIFYVDIPALWDKMDADRQEGAQEYGNTDDLYRNLKNYLLNERNDYI